MKFCSNCGSEINDNAIVCIKCGCAIGKINFIDPNDSSSKGFALLGFFFPVVGLILYLVWNNTNPKKAKSCGIGALLGVIIIPIITFFTLFFVTTSVISYNILNREGRSQTFIITDSIIEPSPEIYQWFTLIGQIRTTTSDPNPYSVVVNLHLGYDMYDSLTATELTARLPELQDYIRTYFRSKSARDLVPSNEENIKQEILENINSRILRTGRIRLISIVQLEIMSMP